MIFRVRQGRLPMRVQRRRYIVEWRATTEGVVVDAFGSQFQGQSASVVCNQPTIFFGTRP